MKSLRIIPKLDIKGTNLVKGIHFEGLRVLGKPERFAQYYYEKGADELIFLDVVASLYGRNSLVDIIEKTSRKAFIPLTVGGGLRSLEDIKKVLRAGADKVSLNTGAINQPGLIFDASKRFGASAIQISIEAIKKTDGTYEAYTDSGREKTGLDVFEWALQVAELGAGEILITSIDREGTGKGFDLELTRKISESVSIPVIASGGAGKLTDIYDVVTKGKPDAVSLGSLLHYNSLRYLDNTEDYFNEGNIDYLKSGRDFPEIEEKTLPEIKEYLTNQGIECRYGNLLSEESLLNQETYFNRKTLPKHYIQDIQSLREATKRSVRIVS